MTGLRQRVLKVTQECDSHSQVDKLRLSLCELNKGTLA